MKQSFSVILFAFLAVIMSGCVAVGGTPDSGNGNGNGNGTTTTTVKEKRTISRTEALDALFDNTNLGEVTLTFTDENWNKLVSNSNKKVTATDGNGKTLGWTVYDKTLYSSCDFVYKKGDKTYTMSNIGIKNRGNTSFRAPQNSSGDYQQAHFKLKFTKYEDDDAHHLERSAKAMNLKFMVSDSSYVQEVYCYDLFRRFGVLTAPRASYTKLYITVGATPKAYFGIYKSIEAIDKQYLKERVAAGIFKGDDGNLWKCLYQSDGPADMTSSDAKFFGVDTASHTPVYSLKTNEDDEKTKAAAITQFKTFINNLNSKSGDDFKTWIDSAFDVDGFLKALAVDVACGMWDDIWRNYNNYYFYFDTDGKAYFIPYDYDNSLGAPNDGLMPQPAEQNPLKWGTDQAVLVKKILDIDEYLTKYKQYLADLASDDNEYLKLSASQSRINEWYNLIESYCNTADYDASWKASKDGASDWSLHKGKPSSLYNFLTNENNYFTLRCAAINDAVDSVGNNDDNNNPPSAELLGYDVSGDYMVFTFDPEMYDLGGISMAEHTDDLYLRGGFNNWGNSAWDDVKYEWRFQQDGSVWIFSESFGGNIGTPREGQEFKYWLDDGSDGGKWFGISDRKSEYALPASYSDGKDGNIIIKY